MQPSKANEFSLVAYIKETHIFYLLLLGTNFFQFMQDMS